MKENDRLAATVRFVVDHRRHAIVGTDAQKVRLELIPAADVARHDAVGQGELFQKDGDFLAVGRWPVVQVDHWDGSR